MAQFSDGRWIKEKYEDYRKAQEKNKEDILHVENIVIRAESHLAGLIGMRSHVRPGHINTIMTTIKTFREKLHAVDKEVERLRGPFGVRKHKYIFFHKDLRKMIEELDHWCRQLDHDHLRRHISYENERLVREESGWARVMASVEDFLARPEAYRISAGGQVTRGILPAPVDQRLIEIESLDGSSFLPTPEPSLPKAKPRRLTKAPPKTPSLCTPEPSLPMPKPRRLTKAPPKTSSELM
jgi:hypothetical protein